MLTPKEQQAKALENNFTYHPPHGNQAERYNHLRLQAKFLATELIANCPPSRELSEALTRLEEAVFWANAAIARNEKNITAV